MAKHRADLHQTLRFKMSTSLALTEASVCWWYFSLCPALFSALGSLGAHRVSPRGLNTTMLRSLVNVEGIITKMSLVRPKLTLSVHYSDGKIGAKQERYVIRSHRDATSATGLPTAPIIPTRDEDGNMLIPEWGLSKFKYAVSFV